MYTYILNTHTHIHIMYVGYTWYIHILPKIYFSQGFSILKWDTFSNDVIIILFKMLLLINLNNAE